MRTFVNNSGVAENSFEGMAPTEDDPHYPAVIRFLVI